MPHQSVSKPRRLLRRRNAIEDTDSDGDDDDVDKSLDATASSSFLKDPSLLKSFTKNTSFLNDSLLFTSPGYNNLLDSSDESELERYDKKRSKESSSDEDTIDTVGRSLNRSRTQSLKKPRSSLQEHDHESDDGQYEKLSDDDEELQPNDEDGEDEVESDDDDEFQPNDEDGEDEDESGDDDEFQPNDEDGEDEDKSGEEESDDGEESDESDDYERIPRPGVKVGDQPCPEFGPGWTMDTRVRGTRKSDCKNAGDKYYIYYYNNQVFRSKKEVKEFIESLE